MKEAERIIAQKDAAEAAARHPAPADAHTFLWQCQECGLARPVLDDDWTCDCPSQKQEEAYNWRRLLCREVKSDE